MIVTLALLCLFLVLLISFDAFKLRRFPFGFGLFFLFWGVLQYGQFYLVGVRFFFPEWMIGKDEFYILASLLITISYLITFYFFLRRGPLLLSWYNPKTRELSVQIIPICALIMLIYCLVTLRFTGTINLIVSLSDNLTNRQIRGIQTGFGVYIMSFTFELLRIGTIAAIMFCIRRQFFLLSLLFLVVSLYLQLLTGSKYAFVILFSYLAILHYNGFYRIRIWHLLILALLPLLLMSLNLVRSGTFTGEIGIERVVYLYGLMSWRGDFFHGLYHLVEAYSDGNIASWYGLNFIFLFLRFIPRTFFPERPGGTDMILTQQIFGFDSEVGWAMNFGGFGDAFLAGGVYSILIVAFFGALLVSAFDRLYRIGMAKKDELALLCSLSCPLWYAPWNVGLNDLVARNLVMWLVAFFVIKVFMGLRLR